MVKAFRCTVGNRCLRPRSIAQNQSSVNSGWRPPTMWISVTASLHPSRARCHTSSSDMVYALGSRTRLPKAHKRQLATHTSVGLMRSEEHTSELQSLRHLVCRLLLEKKKIKTSNANNNDILHIVLDTTVHLMVD